MIEGLVIYAAGVLTGPVIKPVFRGATKGTIKIGLHVKKLANEARSEMKGISTEANAEMRPEAVVVSATGKPEPVVVTATSKK